MKGKTFDIQGFSVQDGPGIRTTVFLKGCPLRCPWCHSPESQEFHSELNWLSLRCLGLDACGNCLNVCPHSAISPAPSPHKNPLGDLISFPIVDKSLCDDCGICANACRANALYLCGSDLSVEQVFARILRDLPFFEESGGGVTFSGGECLCQPDFTLALLRMCREHSIHTAVDTTGFVHWSVFDKVLPFTDLFLYDLKCMDNDLHLQVIGVPNLLILDNLRKLADAGARLIIRIPVIPLFNDSVEHFQLYADFLSSIFHAIDIVQLLPYHKLGLSKHDRLMKNQKVFVAEPPPDHLLEARKALLESAGLNVRIH